MVHTRPNGPPAPTFERKVACQECGRTFARKADLQQHQDHTRHQRIDDLTGATCKGCRKTFACSADLQTHQKSTRHEPVEDRTYGLIYTHQDAPALTSVACIECRKTFACKANLQQHQQSAINEASRSKRSDSIGLGSVPKSLHTQRSSTVAPRST